MIEIMPAMIGGDICRMWLTMEPRVRSFISFHFRRRGDGAFVPLPRASFRCCDASELHDLTLEQAAIDSPGLAREHGMGALLDDLAAVEHQDPVEAAHRR